MTRNNPVAVAQLMELEAALDGSPSLSTKASAKTRKPTITKKFVSQVEAKPWLEVNPSRIRGARNRVWNVSACRNPSRHNFCADDGVLAEMKDGPAHSEDDFTSELVEELAEAVIRLDNDASETVKNFDQIDPTTSSRSPGTKKGLLGQSGSKFEDAARLKYGESEKNLSAKSFRWQCGHCPEKRS